MSRSGRTRARARVFRYAVSRGLAIRNPAAEFKPNDILAAARTENFARIDARDLPELLTRIDEYNGDAVTRFGLKLLAYIFVRTNELIEAPWSEFSLNDAVWIIPPERMKMRTPHIGPLSRQAVEVLRALRLLTGRCDLVFPGANNKKRPMSNNTLLYALYRLGYRGRMTGHGFRGLASRLPSASLRSPMLRLQRVRDRESRKGSRSQTKTTTSAQRG